MKLIKVAKKVDRGGPCRFKDVKVGETFVVPPRDTVFKKVSETTAQDLKSKKVFKADPYLPVDNG